MTNETVGLSDHERVALMQVAVALISAAGSGRPSPDWHWLGIAADDHGREGGAYAVLGAVFDRVAEVYAEKKGLPQISGA
jgi:hypothetical protein